MKKKAAALEPENMLYEWSTYNNYYNIKEECEHRKLLAKTILAGPPEKSGREEGFFWALYP
jgi:hypothetical protein